MTHDKSLDLCTLEAKDVTEEEAKLKMLCAATVLLCTAVLSLCCAFSEEKGGVDNDWKDMCGS